MSARRRAGEEGQVTPALLAAVLGGFALAVAFVALQDVLDQSGRAASASDAAALAVGQEHQRALLEPFEGNSGNHLGQLRRLLDGTGTPRAADVAQDYAEANGADAVAVAFDGFDPGHRRWEYTVTTRQRDTVRGGESTARSESRSTVAVEVVAGLCTPPGSVGLIVRSRCVGVDDLVALCDLELDPPPPSPSDPATPTTDPTAEPPEEPSPPEGPPYTPPPGLDGLGCVDPRQGLAFDVRLVP